MCISDLTVYQMGVTTGADDPAMRLFPVVLLASLGAAPPSAAQTVAPGNPAPMNGIWKLTALTPAQASDAAFKPEGQLFIVSGELRGNYGCGRFVGRLGAAANALRVQVRALPPRPTERCVFARDNSFTAALGAAAQYTISRDHLVLFSKAGRLTFGRIGFVTPGKK